MTETTQKLISVAAKRFNVDAKSLKPTDDIFERLRIDSIAALNLLSELESVFQVEIPDYELQGVKTFEQLAQIIEVRL